MKIYLLLLISLTHLWAAPSIFRCDFDNEPVGTYTPEQMKAAWNNPTWENGLSEGRGDIVQEDGKTCLRILYPEGTLSAGGAKWEMDLGQLYDTLWVSYNLKFQDGFDFVKGGKLPGLGGGSTPTGGQPVTGAEGFSARIMWKYTSTASDSQGVAAQYIYHMDQPSTYGEYFYYAYPNPSWSSTRRYFEPGNWHNVKTRIIINTPGEYDGRVTSWLDGELAMDSLSMRFRADGAGHFGVDKFLFSTFFGGGDVSWAASKDEYIYFDDFVISETDPDLVTITTVLKQDTITTVVKADSVEIDSSLVGVSEKEDTIVTTVTITIFSDSLFTITDSIADGEWFNADTTFNSEEFRNDTTDVKVDTLKYQGSVAIILTDENSKSVTDLLVAPNPVQQTAKGVDIIIPSDLSGHWKIILSDALGNLMDEAEFEAVGGTTYTWDLHNEYGIRVASGSYALFAQFTDRDGRTQIFRRMIGVKK